MFNLIDLIREKEDLSLIEWLKKHRLSNKESSCRTQLSKFRISKRLREAIIKDGYTNSKQYRIDSILTKLDKSCSERLFEDIESVLKEHLNRV